LFSGTKLLQGSNGGMWIHMWLCLSKPISV
jgi:hypothetical protein